MSSKFRGGTRTIHDLGVDPRELHIMTTPPLHLAKKRNKKSMSWKGLHPQKCGNQNFLPKKIKSKIVGYQSTKL